MIAFTRQTARMSVVAWVVLGLAGWASAQTATQPAVRGAQQGKIKGDNVYVRSGSHTNYYPVTKLNRGDPVTVVGEEYGWFEIQPPAGTFSLIEKTYVDRTGDTGKLNEERKVYAGSNLDNRRYAVQARLEKGDTVRILGETDDGAFLKIEPPPGAHLWVKADFVEGVTATGATPTVKPPETVSPEEIDLGGGRLPPLTTRPADLGGGGIVTTTRPAGRNTRLAGRTDRPGPIKATQQNQEQIDTIEAKIDAEKDKPNFEQTLEALLPKLRPIASQGADEIAAIYAQARIKQIEGYLSAHAGLRKIEEAREKAIREADRIAAERLRIQTMQANPADEIVVRGEIRVSTVYEGRAGQSKRWRVVEPSAGYSARTIAYIELPPDSTIDPTSYYGKYVGIRASARNILRESNPPIPIYTVAEIVVLDRESGAGRVSGTSAYASPTGPTVKPPASQPASGDEDGEK